MHEKKPGVYPLIEKMPCTPNSLAFPYYRLYDTLDGHMEMEEAAARILSFSQQHESWVGVSWDALTQQVASEQEELRQIRLADFHNEQTIRLYMESRDNYRTLVLCTFGLASLFRSKPARPKLLPVPKSKVEVPPIGIHPLSFVSDGIHGLIDKGYLRQEEVNPDSPVFFPTITLIQRILFVQGAPAA